VNTVLRNIKWNANGKDEIINFNIIYGSCGKTIAFISENTELVSAREITITFPASNAVIVDAFKAAIRASRAAGKNPRMAIFDTVSSMPGLRLPFEELTSVCAAEGVLSLIDGAHGIGHIPLNLTTVNPDFFVSNTHKWLFVPRGSAILYVPERNQHLIRSTLPTSHGFIPVGSERDLGPLPPSTKSNFISQFNSYGTIDNANYLCIPTAVKFREEVCGGEAAITSYCISLAKEGGARVAAIMGTQVLDNEDHTLTDCALVNVELPISFGAGPGAYQNIVPVEHKSKVHEWILKTLLSDYHTFIAIVFFQGRFWARLSAQVYLDLADFEWAGRTLKDVSERAGKGEYLETTN
jgi:selenocysteine lyase/cysteine desulfurase